MALHSIEELIVRDDAGFACAKSKLVLNGVVHLRPFNIGPTSDLVLDEVYKVPRSEVPVDKGALLEGDILFNNTNSVELVGKAALVRTNLEYGYSNHLSRIRLDRNKVEPGYFAYWLQKLYAAGHFRSHSTQWVSQAAFRVADLRKLTVNVPPLPEQRRIVDILDRVASIQKLRKQAEAKAQEIIPALFVDMFGDPAVGAKTWPRKQLNDVVKIVSSVVMPDQENEPYAPCIGSDAIKSNAGKLLFRPTVREVMPRSGKYRFCDGDVLYSKIRPALRKATIVREAGFCSADIYALRPSKILQSEYLLSLLLTDHFTDFAVRSSARAQIPKTNRDALGRYELGVPPIELQRDFARRVKALENRSDRSSMMETGGNALMLSLMNRLFGNSPSYS